MTPPPGTGTLHPLSALCGPVAAQVSGIHVFVQVRARAMPELRHLAPREGRALPALSAAVSGSELSPKRASTTDATRIALRFRRSGALFQQGNAPPMMRHREQVDGPERECDRLR